MNLTKDLSVHTVYTLAHWANTTDYVIVHIIVNLIYYHQ
jgi:hypothetical protein